MDPKTFRPKAYDKILMLLKFPYMYIHVPVA